MTTSDNDPDEFDTPDPHFGHRGFYVDVDGEAAHVLADPNMSPETEKALAAMIRAAREMFKKVCPQCGNKYGEGLETDDRKWVCTCGWTENF